MWVFRSPNFSCGSLYTLVAQKIIILNISLFSIQQIENKLFATLLQKYLKDQKINLHLQLQLLELLCYYNTQALENLEEWRIDFVLTSCWTTSGLNYQLNSIWHTLNQVIPTMIFKVISNINKHILYDFHRCNMTIFLWNLILYMHLNILNWIEIREIEEVLITYHSEVLFNRNAYFFINRSIMLYDN